MRKGMWKKGLTVAMAAAMLAGPVSVPAVFNNGVAVVKADETNKEQDIYVLMNIPYADFYKAELNKNDVKVDVTTSATKAKTRSTLANGSYHADNTGEHISGITYPVKIKAGTDLSNLTKITDASKVSITVNMKGKEITTEYKGKDALFESADYSYYVLSTAPAYYKELTVNEDGTYSFGKTTATEKTVEGAAIEKFKTSSNYGDYQLNLNFDKVADSDQISGNTKVLAAVITTTDGTQYGLRHVENIWKGTEFAWGTGFTTQSHGCPISGEHYASMMGKKIDAVTYYTENGVVKYDIDDTYVPYKFDTSAFKVENADVTSGSAKVTVPTLPEAYDAEYAVEGLTNVSVENGTLKYNATGVKPGQYTLNVTDKSSKYVPFSTSFTLTTDNVVAVYNNNVKAPALVAAKDVQADDFANFVKNIQKVSVNGKEYAASGKGSVKLINEDGTLVTTADALKAEGKDVIGVGKIYDIFEGQGVTETYPNQGNEKNMEKTIEIQKKEFDGLCYVNLVDGDMIYGHRRDIAGYAGALTRFDEQLGEFLANMRDDDMLMITADHGCDPGYTGTDHTREYVPCLIYGKEIKAGVNLHTRKGFADMAATIAEALGSKYRGDGESFWDEIRN